MNNARAHGKSSHTLHVWQAFYLQFQTAVDLYRIRSNNGTGIRRKGRDVHMPPEAEKLVAYLVLETRYKSDGDDHSSHAKGSGYNCKANDKGREPPPAPKHKPPGY